MAFRPTQVLVTSFHSLKRRYSFTIHYNLRNGIHRIPSSARAINAHRSLHTALWPPLVFAQLLLALWAYKVAR